MMGLLGIERDRVFKYLNEKIDENFHVQPNCETMANFILSHFEKNCCTLNEFREIAKGALKRELLGFMEEETDEFLNNFINWVEENHSIVMASIDMVDGQSDQEDIDDEKRTPRGGRSSATAVPVVEGKSGDVASTGTSGDVAADITNRMQEVSVSENKGDSKMESKHAMKTEDAKVFTNGLSFP